MATRSGDESRTNVHPAQPNAGAAVLAMCDAGVQIDHRATCSVELPAEPPEWIHLMTPGQMNARDGRRFLLENADKVVSASLERSKTFVIDYEHQTDLAEKNGQPAPAAGWINELAVRLDGIWGRVSWTEKAAAMIRAREYRFLSPTFTHSKEAPHRVGVILRAALTNNPALELTALATNQDGDPDMEFLKALAKVLGLGDYATEAEILAALEKNTAALASATALATATRTALELDAKADDKAIAGAIDKLKTDVATANAAADGDESKTPDPAKFVPIEQVAQLTDQVAQLTAEIGEDKATAAVSQAMNDGKLPPALKDWGTAYAKSDLAGFVAYCKKQPVLFKQGSDVPNDLPNTADGQLTAAEKAICKATGVSEDAFLATRKKELEASA